MAGVAVMVRDKYAVRLAAEQRKELQRLIRVGKHPAESPPGPGFSSRATTVGRLPKWLKPWMRPWAQCTGSSSALPKKGWRGVLKDRPQANRHRKLDDRGEAHLIALACSPPPAGHDHWTLRLLAGKVVELKLASPMSHEGVRQRLKKTPSSRGRRRSGAFPR